MKQNLLRDRGHIEFLTRLASLYFLEGKTQAQVAEQLNISRQKVQRFLGQCRELGIVEINIRNPLELSLDLENRLKERFGLRDVVLAVPSADETERRHSVARAAAGYLERWLNDGMTVAVGMGRNTGELPRHFRPSRQIRCTFVSAMGSSPHVARSINPNDIVASLAANCGGRAMPLLAPAYVESQEVRDILLSQAAVGPALRKAMKADLAVVGVGAPTDDATLVRMECLSRAESRLMKEQGAVGDILGVYFDELGNMIASDLHGRLVGLSLYDLRHIKTVVALVSERHKARAILGALRTEAIQVLVTDADNGREVLRLADMPDAAPAAAQEEAV